MPVGSTEKRLVSMYQVFASCYMLLHVVTFLGYMACIDSNS